MLRELNIYMASRQHLCLPTMENIRPGRLVTVRFNKKGWLRGEVITINGTTCTTFLGDYGIAMDCPVAELRSLPPRFHSLPWQTVRIRLRGVKLRSRRPLQRTTQIAELVMARRKGLLANVQSTLDGLTATLTLDRLPGQPSLDVIEHWLQIGYVVPSNEIGILHPATPSDK